MSSVDPYHGVLAPVVTPFDTDLVPDASRLIGQCRWLLSQKVKLAVLGTNSEANSMSVHEKIELLDQLVDAGIDPNMLMPGTGCCALPDSVRLSAHAVKLGCPGVLMLPPFYYKDVTDSGLYDSFADVINRVGDSKLRIYLYNIPQVSGIPISLPLIEKLVTDFPGAVVGVKDSSGDWSNTKAMLTRGWEGFAVYAGSERTLLANMRNGGAGCISATANVNPKAIHELYVNWEDRDADHRQDKLNGVRAIFEGYPMIPALKAAIAHYSNDSSWEHVRPPLKELDSELRAKLIEELKSHGFSMKGPQLN